MRFFYFPFGVPLSLDSISYFSYAVDIAQTGKFPVNYDLVNNGWSTFLSPFFTFLKFVDLFAFLAGKFENYSKKNKTPRMRWGLLILGGLFYIKVYYRH